MSGKMPHGKDLASARRQDPLATSALFILYSWNYDLLRTALQAYVAAGWGPRIIVIDNSSDKRILHDSPVSHPWLPLPMPIVGCILNPHPPLDVCSFLSCLQVCVSMM